MPVRLIGTIILLLAVTLFAGANLDNRCNINFIFKTVQNVPVFLTAVVSFLAGAIVMIPFTFHSKKNGNDSKISKQKNQDEESKTLFDFKIKKDVSKNQKKEKKPFFKKSEKKEEAPKNPEDKSSAEEKSSDEKESVSSENADSSL